MICTVLKMLTASDDSLINNVFLVHVYELS